MSKKSRRRNKKILAALALAGGAAMLGRGRNLGVSGADKAKFTSDAAYSIPKTATNFITKKAKPVIVDTGAADTGSNFQSRFKTKVGNKWVGPNEARGYAPVTDVINPNIDNPYTAPKNIKGRLWSRNLKSGGRVTGIAKRGFGRALMKGKK
jgi:hypothetical protein